MTGDLSPALAREPGPDPLAPAIARPEPPGLSVPAGQVIHWTADGRTVGEYVVPDGYTYHIPVNPTSGREVSIQGFVVPEGASGAAIYVGGRRVGQAGRDGVFMLDEAAFVADPPYGFTWEEVPNWKMDPPPPNRAQRRAAARRKGG